LQTKTGGGEREFPITIRKKKTGRSQPCSTREKKPVTISEEGEKGRTSSPPEKLKKPIGGKRKILPPALGGREKESNLYTDLERGGKKRNFCAESKMVSLTRREKMF